MRGFHDIGFGLLILVSELLVNDVVHERFTPFIVIVLYTLGGLFVLIAQSFPANDCCLLLDNDLVFDVLIDLVLPLSSFDLGFVLCEIFILPCCICCLSVLVRMFLCLGMI